MFSERIEQWAKDYESKGRLAGLNEGRLAGLNEGRCAEAASTLLRLITRKFGNIPEIPKSQIEHAGIETLELWLDRLLDAKTIGEVFDGARSNEATH